MLWGALLAALVVTGVAGHPVGDDQEYDHEFVLRNLTAIWEELQDLRMEINYHMHEGHEERNHDQALQEVDVLKHEHRVHHLHHPHEEHNAHHDGDLLRHLTEVHGHMVHQSGGHEAHGHSHGHHHGHQEGDDGDHEGDGQRQHENEDIHDTHGLHSGEDDHEHGHGHEHDHIHDDDHEHGASHEDEDSHAHGHKHGHNHIHDDDHEHGASHEDEDSHVHGHKHGHSHIHDDDHEHGASHEDEDTHVHGHGHGHSHSHGHGHGRRHCRKCGHSHGHGHGHGHSHKHGHKHGQSDANNEVDGEGEDSDDQSGESPRPRPGLALIPGREAQDGMPPADPWMHATCDLQPNVDMPESNVSGNIVISQKKDKKGPVFFDIHLTGVDVAAFGRIHGFHVHENSVTEGSCGSTRGHFNPEGVVHGGPEDEVRHVGDLGNIEVDENGELHGYIISDKEVAFTGTNSIIGKALVLHTGVDDLGRGGDSGSLATGNSGGRLACCTIHMKAVTLFRFKG